MPICLAGLGTALPSTVSQEEAIAHAKLYCCHTHHQERIVEKLYRRTSIETRATVLKTASTERTAPDTLFFPPDGTACGAGPTTAERMQRYAEHVGPLAVTAARAAGASIIAGENEAFEGGSEALDSVGFEGAAAGGEAFDLGAITDLITVSCTGFAAPGFDLALIAQLPLNPEVSRTHIGFMGCHGALNGLRVAGAILTANPLANVLLCAAELCSLHFQYGWEPDNIVANSLFSDGAAAAILRQSQTPATHQWQYRASGSLVVRDSADAMTWSIKDNGFVMTLSAEVPDLISQHLRPWLESWLAKHGMTLAEVPSWAVHPGGPRILDAVQESLALSSEQMQPSRSILSECGNMSSPTILFIMDRLQRIGAPTPCVLLGFGPGLAIEAALFV